MNPNNDQNINSISDTTPIQTTPPDPQKEKNSNMLWALVLIIMAACVVFALWYSKNNLKNNTLPVPEPMMDSTIIKNETTVVEEDAKKDETTVTDEVLQEIDELRYEDVQGAYDEKQLEDINQ